MRGVVASVWRAGLAAAILACVSSCSFILPRNTARYIQYPVKQGDTLYTIGQRFDVSVSQLIDVNDVDPRSLRVGEILKVPFKGQSLARNGNDLQNGIRAFNSRKSERVTTGLRQVKLGPAGRQVGRLSWPIEGGRVSSRFGWRWLSFHEGIDISAAEGTPIYAAQSGTVVYSGDGLSGYGNLVVLRSENLLTIYAHNSRNTVSVGDRVDRGDQIAEVGSTGHATGSHLHFETRIKDQKGRNVAVDPIVFFKKA